MDLFVFCRANRSNPPESPRTEEQQKDISRPSEIAQVKCHGIYVTMTRIEWSIILNCGNNMNGLSIVFFEKCIYR